MTNCQASQRMYDGRHPCQRHQGHYVFPGTDTFLAVSGTNKTTHVTVRIDCPLEYRFELYKSLDKTNKYIL